MARSFGSFLHALVPRNDDDSAESLGAQYTGLLCLMATGVHLLMAVSSAVGSGQREHWELVFLLVTGPCYVLWRLGCKEPEAHLQCSRQICKVLSWLACVRWIAIWTFPDPQTAFINVVSGLLYLPLLLGCLMLLGGSQAGINGLIGCFSLTPLLLGQQEIIRETPFSDWRLGPSIAGAYVVYRQLVLSVLRLKSRVHGLAIDNNQLKLDAVLDPLTATLNRRGFMNGCQAMRRHRCGLIMLDIDHFKAINDVHGHQVGDEVLVRVAAALQAQLRASDLICRWGGEEFLVMVQLAGSSQQAQDNLQKLAGTLVRAVRSLTWAPVCAGLDQVTISAGARMLLNGMDIQTCVDEADQALLQAKRSGRNRVGCRQTRQRDQV